MTILSETATILDSLLIADSLTPAPIARCRTVLLIPEASEIRDERMYTH